MIKNRGVVIRKGPWTVKRSREVYKNPWIEVREDQVIRPDGKDGIFGIVNMRAGVSILPIDESGNVYLAEQYRYATEKVTIEAVSGAIEDTEDKLIAAKRELEEESGIIAKEWFDMGYVDPFTNIIKSPNYMYIAKGLTFSQSHQDGTENIKIVKMPSAEAVKRIEEGEITHSATVVLILKASGNDHQ